LPLSLLVAGLGSSLAGHLGAQIPIGDTGQGGSVTSSVAILNATNSPLISGTTRRSDGSLTIHFLSIPSSTNVLFSTTDLMPPVAWQPVATFVAPPDGAWHYTDTNPTTCRSRFFRCATGWQPWVPATVPIVSSWVSVASSADGTKLVAAGYPGYPWNFDPWTSGASWAQTKISVSSAMAWLYVSSDSGATWTRTSAPSNYWISVASSADGTKLAAVAADQQQGVPGSQTSYTYGTIYFSADSGNTWSKTATPSISWEAESSVAISADGAQLVASAYFGAARIYTSTDSGATWLWRSALTLPSTVLSAIACSADGSRIVAAVATGSEQGGPIYRSPDAGATWARTGAPGKVWSSVATSADGNKLVATVGYGYTTSGPIYTSADAGITWRPTSAPCLAWSSVASSRDGTKLVAAAFDGAIYLSPDSGDTWTSTSAPSQHWSSVASSEDGTKLVAVSVDDQCGNGGSIYTLQLPFSFPPVP
jgi:hypothetical protein